MNSIRRPLFDGMREIHAIWFDLELIGEAQARLRVLGHWQAGARLHRADGGYLLTLARPRLAHCGALDGLAMCKVDGVLSSAPLEADEKMAIPHGACWLVRGAQAHAIELADADLVDPAAWIDLSAIVIRQPLKFPETKARVAFDAPKESKSLRDILDGVIPPPSERRDEFLRALRGEVPEKKIARAGVAGGLAGAAGLLAGAGIGLLASLIGKLLSRATGSGSGAGSANEAGAGSGTGAGTAGQAARPGPDPAWKQRLHATLARLAALTRMSKMIGWGQAAYLRRMVDMFERGDISEALRHAIPLDDEALSGKQALGQLKARTSLDITAPGGTASTITLQEELKEYLRKSYRKLFERLEREGRIDEATFVLAELLKSGVEAVDYLERHARLKQAAELAETLQLPAAVAVRLWILAGDAPRAVRIARLHGAFAEAILQLERKQSAEAGPLRLLWSEYLADRGDLVEAAEVIWPLEAYRSLALRWLLLAEQGGRTLGARALVRKLSLMPESLADSAPAIFALLDSQAEDGPQLRAALAAELVGLGTQSAATKRLAGEVLRYVIPERSAGLNQLDKNTFNKLLAFGDAGLFKSDLPALSFDRHSPTPGANPAQPPGQPLQGEASECGLMQIHDARRLPDGHYLIALGESGVVRINAHGKQLVHFPLPAYHLVLATNGERVLALARRGDVIRASRIDLTTCKVSDWLSHPFDSWADQFDGVVWNAVIDNRIVAIDTSKDQLYVIWQVADLPGKVIDFLDDGASQTILIAREGQLQQWRYDLPARRLCQRDVVAFPPDGVTKVLAHAGSPSPMLVWTRQDTGGCALVANRPNGGQLTVRLGMANEVLGAEIKDGLLLVHARTADGVHACHVVDRHVDQVIAQLRLPNAEHPGAAAHDGHLLLFDRRGRLIDVDVSNRSVRCMTLN